MQLDIFAAHDFSAGKTCPEVSQATAGETLLLWLAQWLEPNSVYRETDGKTPVLLSDETDSSSGACWTRNMCEHDASPTLSRKGAVVCSLSSILETGEADRRFYLTPKACRGILRRAEKRGKELPIALHRALAQVAGDLSEPEKPGDKTL